MLLQHLHPHPLLAPYVSQMWLFESDFGVPIEDVRTIVPNGKAKIIYSFKNALCTIEDGIKTQFKEHDIFFIGVWDKPVTLYSESRYTGTIGIELTPFGVHRFLQNPLHELKNKVISFSDIFGKDANQLLEQLNNTSATREKINLLQHFLIKTLSNVKRENILIDYCSKQIIQSNGLYTINELEKKTGYTKRYLDKLFNEYVGISPKTLSGITRFQSFYVSWANASNTDFNTNQLYDFYYDQSHFIKEFKKFSGYSPLQYAKTRNEFGKIFYKK